MVRCRLKSDNLRATLINSNIHTYIHTRFKLILFDFDSEVVLGEWKVGTDPDCKPGAGWCAPKKITRGIAEIIKHESYHGPPKYQNDISLIRLNESVPLFQDVPQQSYASPVCLPWTDETDLQG